MIIKLIRIFVINIYIKATVVSSNDIQDIEPEVTLAFSNQIGLEADIHNIHYIHDIFDIHYIHYIHDI